MVRNARVHLDKVNCRATSSWLASKIPNESVLATSLLRVRELSLSVGNLPARSNAGWELYLQGVKALCGHWLAYKCKKRYHRIATIGTELSHRSSRRQPGRIIEAHLTSGPSVGAN